MIAACSETKGPVHFVVACHDHYGVAPFRLENPGAQVLLGPAISLDDFPPGAFSPEDVASSGFPAKHGASIMEVMRRKPARIIGWEREFFAVGGLCDLTTVNAAGADVRPLCGWADEVGKIINPESGRIYEGFTYGLVVAIFAAVAAPWLVGTLMPGLVGTTAASLATGLIGAGIISVGTLQVNPFIAFGAGEQKVSVREHAAYCRSRF